MATLNFRSNMISWKIYTVINGTKTDRTSQLNGVVSSFKVTHGISSPKTRNKKESAPSTFEMQISSDNYVEDIFTEGVELEVMVGKNSASLTTVFKGKIKLLPDGSSRELLDYTVKAYGFEIKLSDETRNYNFRGKSTSDIVLFIAERNKFEIGKIDITPESKMGAGFQKLQKNMTDTELLDKLSAEWGCSWWVKDNVFYFMNFSKIFTEGDKINDPLESGLPYPLYYRSNLKTNNVETVKWSFRPPPGGSETQSAFEAFNEFGKDPSVSEYKVKYKGQYYKLDRPYEDQAKNDKKAFGKHLIEAAQRTALLDSERLLKKFFVIVPDSQVKNKRNIPEIGDNAGVEITIHLNEGDETLFPPRSAILNSGTLGRVKGGGPTDLPAWMFRFGDEKQTVAKLNIKETVLTYEEGMLRSELKCSMGVPTIGSD